MERQAEGANGGGGGGGGGGGETDLAGVVEGLQVEGAAHLGHS